MSTDEPNELRGTDATKFFTREEGWFFGAIDDCVADVVGWHVAKKGDQRPGFPHARGGPGADGSLDDRCAACRLRTKMRTPIPPSRRPASSVW